MKWSLEGNKKSFKPFFFLNNICIVCTYYVRKYVGTTNHKYLCRAFREGQVYCIKTQLRYLPFQNSFNIFCEVTRLMNLVNNNLNFPHTTPSSISILPPVNYATAAFCNSYFFRI